MAKKNEYQYKITVEDDGSASFEKFAGNAAKSSKKAGDVVQKNTKKMRRSLDGVKKAARGAGNAFKTVVKGALSLKGVLVAGIGMFAVIGSIKAVTTAAITQQSAVNRMEAALKSAGSFSEKASKDFQEFAANLQKVSVVGDEVTLDMLALAKSFGFTNEQAKVAVQGALELSVTADIAFGEAVRRVGRTISGSISDVAKFVPELKNLTKEQLAAGDAAVILAEKLKGQAFAQTQTFAGALLQLSNNFGDILEGFGDSIIKSDDLKEALGELIISFDALSGVMDKVVGVKFGDVLAGFIPSAKSLVSVFFNIRGNLMRQERAFTKMKKVITDVSLVVAQVVKKLFDIIAPIMNKYDATIKRILIKTFRFTQEVHRAIGGAIGDMAAAMMRAGVPGTEDMAIGLMKMSASSFAASNKIEATITDIRKLGKEITIADVITADMTKDIEELTKKSDDHKASIKDQTEAIRELSVERQLALAQLDAEIAKEKERRIALLTAPPGEDPEKKIIPGMVSPEDAALAVQSQLDLLNIQKNNFNKFTSIMAKNSKSALLKQSQLTRVFNADLIKQSVDAARAETTLAGKKNAIMMVGAAGLAGVLMGIAENSGGTMFKIAKKFAIADALISTYQGAAAALRLGWPQGLFAAATVLASGFQSIASIKSASPGGGGGGGGAPASPAIGDLGGQEPDLGNLGGQEPIVAEAAPEAIEELPEEEIGAGAGTSVNVSVQGFVGDEATLASELGKIIREAVGDEVSFGLQAA